MRRANERRAELAVEADEPPICWPGAEAPARGCATASRPLQSFPPNTSLVAATVAPRRGWHVWRVAAYLQGRWADGTTYTQINAQAYIRGYLVDRRPADRQATWSVGV